MKFMHPSVGGRRFFFPKKDDTCWVRESDILCTIEPPNLSSGRRGQRDQSPRLKRLIFCERTLK